MVPYINGEVAIFLWSVVSGAVCAVLYDFFSSFCDTRKFSVFVLNIFDGIFVICATAFLLFVLLNVSNGYIRGYEFVGALIGAIFYKFTLSRLFKFIFKRTIAIFFSIFDFFCNLLLTPIKFMYKIMYNIISMSYRAVLKAFIRIFGRLSVVKTILKKT